LSYVDPDDPDRSELELRLKRKWSDGSESLIFSQRAIKFTVVERLAGVIPLLIFWHGLTSQDFTAFSLQITHGETLWCQVLLRSERAQLMMNLTTLTRRQRASPQLVVRLANIGYRGRSSFAKPWVSIPKYVYAAQE